MNTSIINQINKILDNPMLFCVLRDILNFGNIFDPVSKNLETKIGESIIDVGCGTGDYSKIIPRECTYLGVDVNPRYIQFATKRYGKKGRKEFEVKDIIKQAFPYKSFDKALYISTLHHFDAKTNGFILKSIANATKGSILIVDLICLENKPIQKFFVNLDRGKYIRPLREQIDLIERDLQIEKMLTFENRSRLATHSLFKCRAL